MKQPLINYMQSPKRDELYTPAHAVTPILPYIKPEWVVWECTDHGGSSITKILKQHGNTVHSSHITGGVDFLRTHPSFEYDCIVTNPPFSLKDDFLKRAYELGKPFAFLLPITALEGIKRGVLYRKYGIEVLVLDKRINFMPGKKGAWFNVSWFCWQLLPEKLMFHEVIRDE